MTEKGKRLIENEHVAVKQCKYGTMMYNTNDAFIGRSMDLYGEWCDNELDIIGQILQPGCLVVDVGANIGTHTLFFAQKVQEEGFVLAFEPQRLSFQMLNGNVALNGITNVKTYQTAVSDKEGKIPVPVLRPTVKANYGAISAQGHEHGEEVEVVTIDSLNLARCDLMKIDVEGMETKVLKGAVKTIQAYQPVLFVENNHQTNSKELIETLYDLGYRCYWNIAGYYNPENFLDNEENIFENMSPEVNMLCFPKHIEVAVHGCPEVTGSEDSWLKCIERVREEMLVGAED